MAWDSVPWFVGGGAQHSPEVARLLAYAATSGAEGVVGSGDLKVEPLQTPGSSVRVAPGAALILNRATGGADQTYVGRLATEDTVAIAATGSGAGRSDLVIARIEDPFLAGEPWQDPVDPTVGPYVFTRVISGVPSTTTSVEELGLGYSAIALARIDLPASTATVQASHIVDLRKISNPRRERDLVMKFPGSDDNIPTTTYAAWPDASALTLKVPSWATKFRVSVSLSGIEFIGSSASTAGIRTNIGGTVAQNGIMVESVAGRGHYIVAGEHDVSALQGQTVNFTVEGVRSAGTGSWQADYQSTIVIDYEFVEEAI